MTENLIAGLTLASAAIIFYHHLLFPALLRRLASRRRPTNRCRQNSGSGAATGTLPTITILIPAYQEAAFISDKIRNLGALDYPAGLLDVIVVCDGCTDDTADVARAAAAEPECSHLQIMILDRPDNRGKVAVLNDAVPRCRGEIISLTDVTALLSIDSLRLAASHFASADVGVVCGTYRLLNPGSEGEAVYWNYQTRVKQWEAALGAPLGAHGAFYLFRRSLFRPLPPDTINDDFLLPMRTVAEGWRAIYDTDIVGLELERATEGQDWLRRQRIAVGNLQQVVRLRGLLHPRHGGVAFAFLSGKALRSVMPLLLLTAFFGSAMRAPSSTLFTVLFAAQALTYAVALGATALMLLPMRCHLPNWLHALRYLVNGHAAATVGIGVYVLGGRCGPWGRAVIPRNVPERSHIHPAARIGKRTIDIVVSLFGLWLTLPLWALIALAIRTDSRGPVFFRQERVGECDNNGARHFRMIKFRTMRVDAETATGAVWATQNDPRITRVGRFLRCTRLDELPQFLNVLKGEMSLIGPRPERPCIAERLDAAIPFYAERMVGVKPGITGLAQVHQGYDRSLDDVRSKISYDHAYALALSNPCAWIGMDLHVIVRTVAVMALGRGQ